MSRSSTERGTRLLGAGVLAVVLIASAGCATMQEMGMGGGGDETAAAEETAPAEKAVKQVLTIPAGSPLAKVSAGMSDSEVLAALGDADSTRVYPTWKAWMPYYFGSDTHRLDWLYAGQGKVIFASNRYSRKLKVLQVVYDPSMLK